MIFLWMMSPCNEQQQYMIDCWRILWGFASEQPFLMRTISTDMFLLISLFWPHLIGLRLDTKPSWASQIFSYRNLKLYEYIAILVRLYGYFKRINGTSSRQRSKGKKRMKPTNKRPWSFKKRGRGTDSFLVASQHLIWYFTGSLSIDSLKHSCRFVCLFSSCRFKWVSGNLN